MTECTRVSLTSQWFIAVGNEQTVLDAIRDELIPSIKTGEPGTLTYLVHGSYGQDSRLQSLPPSSDGLLLFFEEYASPQAFLDHVNGPSFTSFVKKYGDCFVQAGGKPFTTVTFLSRHAGFVRDAGAKGIADFDPAKRVNHHPSVMFEVLATDHVKARDFYSKVFDWTFQIGTNDFGYIHFPAGSPQLLGGVGQAQSGAEPGMGPGANFYLLVDDLQATLDRAVAAGGAVLMKPVSVDGYHFAMFTDPEGLRIGLITPFDQ